MRAKLTNPELLQLLAEVEAIGIEWNDFHGRVRRDTDGKLWELLSLAASIENEELLSRVETVGTFLEIINDVLSEKILFGSEVDDEEAC